MTLFFASWGFAQEPKPREFAELSAALQKTEGEIYEKRLGWKQVIEANRKLVKSWGSAELGIVIRNHAFIFNELVAEVVVEEWGAREPAKAIEYFLKLADREKSNYSDQVKGIGGDSGQKVAAKLLKRQLRDSGDFFGN